MLLFKFDIAVIFVIVHVLHEGFCPVSKKKPPADEYETSEYNIKLNFLFANLEITK